MRIYHFGRAIILVSPIAADPAPAAILLFTAKATPAPTAVAAATLPTTAPTMTPVGVR